MTGNGYQNSSTEERDDGVIVWPARCGSRVLEQRLAPAPEAATAPAPVVYPLHVAPELARRLTRCREMASGDMGWRGGGGQEKQSDDLNWTSSRNLRCTACHPRMKGVLRADETRRLVPLHRLRSAPLAEAAEQKPSCNGTVPEAITGDSDD